MDGDISLESSRYVSQEEFVAWVRTQARLGDLNRYELLNGRIVMNPPAGWPHGSIESRVVRIIGNFVDERNLGEVFGSSQGFLLPSGDTVEPDASFLSRAALAAARPVRGEFLKAVPDLVVEILSHGSTASRDRGEKKGVYEQNGVREYWIIDSLACEIIILHLVDGRFDRGALSLAGATARSTMLQGLAFAVASLFPSQP